MVPPRLETTVDYVPANGLPKNAIAFLNHLRFVSMKCRVMRQTSLFEACALLHVDRTASREAYAEALMRCFSEALGQPAKLYAPNTSEMTFDENWLVQLGLASARNDEMSMEFLLQSRVAHQHRRLVRYLIAQIADFFSLN